MKIHCMVKTQYIAQKTESIDSENIKEIIVQKNFIKFATYDSSVHGDGEGGGGGEN